MFAGIDTHKDSLAVAVVDQVGLPVARADEPNTRSGFVRIGELLARHHVTRVGIEGSGHYGRCVAAFLALDWDQADVGVFEVPTLMTSRERGARPGKGKTDPVDAVAIARITMREPDLPPVRLGWRGRCSRPSSGGLRWMLASSPDSSHGSRGQRRRRWPVST